MMSGAELKAYSDVFEQVIQMSPALESDLRFVKDVYDNAVAPWQPFQAGAPKPENARIATLEAENQHLKELAGRLYRERLQRDAHADGTLPQGPPAEHVKRDASGGQQVQGEVQGANACALVSQGSSVRGPPRKTGIQKKNANLAKKKKVPNAET